MVGINLIASLAWGAAEVDIVINNRSPFARQVEAVLSLYPEVPAVTAKYEPIMTMSSAWMSGIVTSNRWRGVILIENIFGVVMLIEESQGHGRLSIRKDIDIVGAHPVGAHVIENHLSDPVVSPFRLINVTSTPILPNEIIAL